MTEQRGRNNPPPSLSLPTGPVHLILPLGPGPISLLQKQGPRDGAFRVSTRPGLRQRGSQAPWCVSRIPGPRSRTQPTSSSLTDSIAQRLSMNLLGHELSLDQCSNLHIPGECRDLSPGESGQSEELSLSTQSANVSACVCGMYVSVRMCVWYVSVCVCVWCVFKQ